MGLHPVNLAFRFLLEVMAILSMICWGVKQDVGAIKYFYILGIPIIMMLIWSFLAVPGDMSRSGKAPIPISGPLRLFIEISFFTIAVLMMSAISQPKVWLGYLILLLLHYVLSYERIIWLLKN